MQDDVNAGFELPIPKYIVKLIKNSVVPPHGIANQFMTNAFGESTEKNLLIHGQSFDFCDEN